MSSLLALAGFEQGTAAGIATGTAGSKIFDALSGTVSVVGAAARSGSYGLRVALTGANNIAWDTNTLGTSKTVLVFSSYFKLSTDATGNATVLGVTTASNGNALEFIYRPGTDDIALWSNVSSSQQVSSGVTITAGTWYRLDVRIDVAANPWVIDWQINGVAQTQFSPASAATTIASLTIGTQTAFTGACDYDDIVASTTSGDYPLGEHQVHVLSVDPAGTVTLSGTATNFRTFTANGTLTAWNATTARNNIDELPPVVGASADGWCQITVAANDYVEMPMTTYTLGAGESIAGCRMVACGWAASTSTAFLGFKSWNGTTERALIDGASYDPGFDNTSTPGWACKMLTLADIDTQSELDALAFRVGYSGDATPDIGIHAIYAEVAVKPSSGQTVTVNQITETDTVQTITPIKTIIQTVNQVVETDTAQTITPVKNALTATVNQTTETDLAQTITPVKTPLTVAVSQVAETDIAQIITAIHPKIIAVGQVSETDVAQTITPIKAPNSVTVGQVVETDLAQSFTRVKVSSVGQVVETDTVQTITPVKASLVVAVGQVVETDFAQSIDPGGPKVRTVGQVIETDLVQTITPIKTIIKAFGQVTETETAQSITVVKNPKTIAVAQVVETDQVQPIICVRYIAMSQVLEVNSVFSMTPVIQQFVGSPGILSGSDSLATALALQDRKTTSVIVTKDNAATIIGGDSRALGQ